MSLINKVVGATIGLTALLAVDAQAQTFQNNVSTQPLPGNATNTVIANPAFYNPAGADGIPGTSDDDLRGDKTQGSPLLDAANTDFVTLDEAINGQPYINSDTEQQDTGSADIGAFESFNESLPVELAGLSARYNANRLGPQDDDVTVTWRTLSEENNAYFSVQQQTSEGWKDITRVQGAGTTNQPQQYNTTLNAPTGEDALTYRLQQVDTDGTQNYSDPITVQRRAAGNSITTYPNPSRGNVTIAIESEHNGIADLDVYNTLGQRVYSQDDLQIREGQNQEQLDLHRLSSGQYFGRITYEDGDHDTAKITLVK
jgi:hypothetical protein